MINQLNVWGSNLRDRRNVSIGLAILGIGLFLWLAIPRVLYLAYQYQGGKQLDFVWNSIDEGKRFPAVCGLSERVNEQQRKELLIARSRLERAIDLLPSATGTYLQLGRVECLTGDFQSAVQSFNTYKQKRPKNQIGYIEAGFAYEAEGDVPNAVNQWKEIGLSYPYFTGVGDGLRKAGLFQESYVWYKIASEILGKPLDDFQDLSENQLIIVDSFTSTNTWKAYPENSPGIFRAADGILTMEYQNDVDNRDFFTYYTTFENLPASNYHEVLIRLKGSPHAYMTIETVIDGERLRPVSYQLLPENWEVWKIPIGGKNLSNLTFGISENKVDKNVNEYMALIDWIAIR